MRTMIVLAGLLLLCATLPVHSEEPASRSAVELILAPGEGSATPLKQGLAYADGGVIHVTRTSPTTVVVTMTGLTAANADLFFASAANYQFDLAQSFEVVINSSSVKSAKLVMEGSVIGMLRTEFTHKAGYLHRGKTWGTAETMPATATVSGGSDQTMTMALPARAAVGCEDLSVYNHEGPVSVPVKPGKYTLHETWGIGVTHAAFHTQGASAEFSPQPNLIPDSYSFTEFRPFNGLATKDFGFQVTLKVVPEY